MKNSFKMQKEGKKFNDSSKRIKLKRLEQYKKEIMEVMDELSEYSLEMSAIFNDYNRKSTEETMMVKGFRKSNQETTNRKTHQENLSLIAQRIAKGINRKSDVKLNCEIIDIMAKNHDIGHTFLGHSGEWWLSNIKEDYGIGYYVHNALGPRELIYTNKIYDKIIEDIKQSNPKIGDKKLGRIKNSLWIIMEAINSHNGERSENEYIPDLSKTQEDFERENLYCFTKKGFDRKIEPATPEAALMRICDKISYIPYDMVDGLRECFINGLDEEYRKVLRPLGITDEEIEECQITKHYEGIARKLQTVCINDIIKNSDLDGNPPAIRMSEDISTLIHELRNINNRQIVDFVVLKEDNATYPPALRTFMGEFSDIILDENLLDELTNGEVNLEKRQQLLEKYKNTPYEGFIQYTCNTNKDDFAYTKKIVELATKQSIEDEQEKAREIVRKREPFLVSPDFKLRDSRIQNYITYYQNKDLENYDKQSEQEDVERIMSNIKDPSKKSTLYLGMNERIALELGAKYLSTLNDIEFMDILREAGRIDDKQYASLTRKYKNINLHDEVYIQENWRKISKAQAESTNESR